MRFSSRILEVQTRRRIDLINITHRVKKFVFESQIRNGICTVFTKHTTTGLMVNENEPGLERDVVEFLKRLVPESSDYYHHHYLFKDGRMAVNAWAHLRSILLGPSISIPVVEGELQLGERENVYLVELDGPQARRIVLHVMGE